MTIDDLVTENEVTIVQVVETYIKHQPHSRKGPVHLKNWFCHYDINTGKNVKKGQGNKYCSQWRRKAKETEFDKWILQQLPPELAKQLEQTPYCQQQFSTEDIVKAYIKHTPKTVKGFVSPRRWFQVYNVNTGKKTKKGRQGNKYIQQWYENYSNTEFDDWLRKQLPKELVKQLEQTPYYQQKEYSIEDIIKSYIKHKPQTRKGLVSPKEWFANYDVNTGDCLCREKSGQGKRYLNKWQKIAKTIEFDDWIKRQIPEKLARRLEQSPYHQKQEITIEHIAKSYIKHQPQDKYGPVSLKSYFMEYDINGKRIRHTRNGNVTITGKSLGIRYYHQWRTGEARKKGISFDEWILKKLSPELAEKLNETVHFNRDAYSIEDILRAYIKYRPQISKGFVPLKNWFAQYDINTGVNIRLQKGTYGQGRKHHRIWAENDKKTEFDEWAATQASQELQDEYFKEIHGIQNGTQVLKALEQAINGQFDGGLLNKEPVRKMLTAYYIEKDLHPEIRSFSPYETMLYLNTKPEERQQLRA